MPGVDLESVVMLKLNSNVDSVNLEPYCWARITNVAGSLSMARKHDWFDVVSLGFSFYKLRKRRCPARVRSLNI